MGLRKIKNPGGQQSFGVLDIVLTIYYPQDFAGSAPGAFTAISVRK